MELARAQGAALVLAHHLDDQVETALLQWMRGAGLEGLSAMPVLHSVGHDADQAEAVWVWRPLLDVSKEALRDWAVSVGLRWVEDPTNLSDRHDRNRLRRDVIPILKEMRGGALASMAQHRPYSTCATPSCRTVGGRSQCRAREGVDSGSWGTPGPLEPAPNGGAAGLDARRGPSDAACKAARGV